MTAERYTVPVRSLVVSLKSRKYAFQTIADKVNERFPSLGGSFTAEDAQKVWTLCRPQDFRTKGERNKVVITLAGPSWSHPERARP